MNPIFRKQIKIIMKKQIEVEIVQELTGQRDRTLMNQMTITIRLNTELFSAYTPVDRDFIAKGILEILEAEKALQNNRIPVEFIKIK